MPDLLPYELLNGTYRTDKSVKYGERLLPQVVDDSAAHDPNHLAGLTARYNSALPMSFMPLTMADLANAANFMSHWIDDILGKGTTSVIGYIGIQDFRYWIMMLAAIKTGHPLLLPSIRNAISNTQNLIRASNCSILFHSGIGTPIGSQARDLRESLPGLEIYAIPSLEDMTSTPATCYAYTKSYSNSKSDIVLILHTSGSTGHPKPIFINHAAMNRVDMDRFVPGVEGRTVASSFLFEGPLYNGSPFFHLSGVIVSCISMFFGTTPVIPPPDVPVTPKVARDIASSIQLRSMFAAPSVMASIFTEYREELREHFSALKQVFWFGG